MDESDDGRPRPGLAGAGEELRAAHLALTFLTVLPLPALGSVPSSRFARASAYYPLAGYVVGGLAAVVMLLPIDPGLRAALALSLWWGLTGLLHLDGLIDSADALLAPVPAARRLEILRDVHVGAFGVGAAVLTALLAWAALSATSTPWAPLIAAVVGRTLVLVPMRWWPPARADGLGATSRTTMTRGRLLLGAVLATPTLLLPGAWLAWLVGLAGTLVVAMWAARRLGGGLTGDAYGLLIVVAELAALVALTT